MAKPWIVATAATLLAAGLLLGGCGGGDDWDSDWYDGAYPYSKHVTIYVRVQDEAGYPVGGCRVKINGRTIDGTTAYRWYYVEEPGDWAGWRYNWAVEDLPVTISEPGQERRLTLQVYKSGYGSDYAYIYVADDDPDSFWVRVTFTLGAPLALQGEQAKVEYLKRK